MKKDNTHIPLVAISEYKPLGVILDEADNRGRECFSDENGNEVIRNGFIINDTSVNDSLEQFCTSTSAERNTQTVFKTGCGEVMIWTQQ